MTTSPDRAGLDYRDELRRLLDAVHDHETGRMAPHHWSDALKRAHGALIDCECVPGHYCDCRDLRSLLYRILTSAEYGKMEAEGLAADALGLRWSEKDDRYSA